MNADVWIGIAIAVLCVRGIIALWRDVFGSESSAPTDIKSALKLVQTPRPTHDEDVWVRYECKPVTCPPPMSDDPPRIVEASKTKRGAA